METISDQLRRTSADNQSHISHEVARLQMHMLKNTFIHDLQTVLQYQRCNMCTSLFITQSRLLDGQLLFLIS